ncbi:type IV secretion protein Dot [uncultured Legionella sp.]|uniref:type IV secretion protein Dot n=1 Tax=uncultured Legionella sp. TaxID=210934 RepID=UPI00260E699A|nr:type IV secretion protein Dot [uncultured Legionella sp.]
MADTNLSSEFASLVKELQNKPEDPVLKQEVFSRLPEMKILAEKNPMDLFRFAQIYSPTSPQYKNMMRQAAGGGCTNAMLSMAELLVKSGFPADLKTAAHYLNMIERSNDSYMIKQSKQLLSSNPELAAEMRGPVKSEPYNPKIRFFSNLSEGKAENKTEHQLEHQQAVPM